MIFGAIGCFNSQPPEGGWFDALAGLFSQSPFQLTAARKRLVTDMGVMPYQAAFQLTAARRRLARQPSRHPNHGEFQLTAARRRLVGMIYRQTQPASFQLTAARRRLAAARVTTAPPAAFQLTAARRRLVGVRRVFNFITSFNSQPPEGGWEINKYLFYATPVSTHSRPKAAGCINKYVPC